MTGLRRSSKLYYLAGFFHFVIAIVIAGALVQIERKERALSDITYRDVAWSATNGRFEFAEMERNLILFGKDRGHAGLSRAGACSNREIFRGRLGDLEPG